MQNIYELIIKPREAAYIMQAMSYLSDAQEEMRLRKKQEPPQILEAKKLLIEAFKQISIREEVMRNATGDF